MAQVIQGNFPVEEAGGVTTGSALSVASLNLSPEPGDVEGNLLLAKNAIIEARREEPSLKWVVLPELLTCGYPALESVHVHAEDAEYGVSARFFTTLARELDLYVAYGFPERDALSASVFDSANLVGPEGVVSTYRKRNLVRTTPEHFVFAAGVDLPVVEAGGLRVALAVCWDLGFPETAREAGMAGADLILAPAAWREPWGAQYHLSCAARALDSGVYVASANQLGSYPEASFGTAGHLYGPDGLRVSRDVGDYSIGTIDPGASERWRRLYGNTLQEQWLPSPGEDPREVRVQPA